jgi:ABC-type glycerol-3-phosphate transport system permease component
MDRVRGQYLNECGQLLAAAFLAVLPIIVMFLISNRQFIKGLTSGAVKGGG